MQDSNRRSLDRWGADPLTQCLDQWRGRQWATFAGKRAGVDGLIAVDGLFIALFADAMALRPVRPQFFLRRAHAAFRSACGAVMGGQIDAGRALCRVCLEEGGRALHVGDDRARWRCWMNRHAGAAARQAARDGFAPDALARSVAMADAALGRLYAALHELADEGDATGSAPGAAVLPAGMAAGLVAGSAAGGGRRLRDDGAALDEALRGTARTGLCVLRIARIIHPDRLRGAGIEARLDDLAGGS